MTDHELRIKCLELALTIETEPNFYTHLACNFYNFITNGTCKSPFASVEEENEHVESLEGGISEYIDELLFRKSRENCKHCACKGLK